MTFTPFGAVIALIGLLLLIRGSATAMLIFVVACSLLGGAAAMNLPALGDASIQPTYFALGFLIVRVLLGGATNRNILPALRNQMFLVVFCLYGVVTAFILPKLFAGQIDVSPMRTVIERTYFDVFPLNFSSQNITTGVYLFGTLLCAVCAYAVARVAGSVRAVVPAFSVIAGAHVFFGLAGLLLSSMGLESIVDFFRNASYAQLSQSFEGFIRVAGIFPEASAYAAYGFAFLVFTCELWLRDVRPRWTGPATLAMFAVLGLSTSATAYVSLVGYGLILLLRWMVLPRTLPARKGLVLFLAGMFLVIGALGALVILPKVASALSDMFDLIIFSKSETISGRQRKFWAAQGWSAFKLSRGLGIGAGSFRSSSIVMAVMGSMGVVGLTAFAGQLLAVLRPLRASTYGRGASEEQSAGAAAAWAAVGGLIPAMVAAPSPDPGILFAVFSGLAVAWRLAPAPVAAPARARRPAMPANRFAGAAR